eukprot:TRINITY_DN61245_c0_g1_i1.p1 TRINITY_DN61245_c0_g1~~TRINITY_DN61245_c0_g1_i1.p1  ORF type:complete len:653 (+),score=104.92 TRINITY_DN61245_c0_g1_i1:90-2048(+)
MWSSFRYRAATSTACSAFGSSAAARGGVHVRQTCCTVLAPPYVCEDSRGIKQRPEPSRASITAAATAAAVAAAAAASSANQWPCSCDQAPISNTTRESDSSVITLHIEQDKPGFLNTTSAVLQNNDLNIRYAKISVEPDGRARHVYVVEDKTTRLGLSDDRLEAVRAAIMDLGSIDCSAKPWPRFTRAEVALHTTNETGIWVTYKNCVYDITDFIANHPGGKDKIMLAAGKAIDPFWRIYQQHEGRGTALTQLDQMRIGDLVDYEPPAVLGEDPYASDPERHPGLIFHNNKPCNAELPAAMMLDSWRTPNPVFFIRHHHPVPMIDGEKYRLIVEGKGSKPVYLTLEDLKHRFVKHKVTATLQCGGNRRSELDKVEKTSGIPWGFGAMSTAEWGGVYLRDVLLHCAGISLEGVEAIGIKHVVFHGIDDMQASIPIEKALSPYGDVLLAFEMNGEELPCEHGFPVRVVVPGVVGVRNVKWVGRIEISTEEAMGTWQRGIAYKGFSPNVKSAATVDVEKVLSVQEMPVTSSIVYPRPGEKVTLDDVDVKGFAWSGGGRGIVRVDVSVDGGKTWITADLNEGSEQNPTRAWAWTFFEVSVPVPETSRGKSFEIMCRATDSSYNAQPERPEPIWNLRGLNCNCWHRVEVVHDDSDDE